jgi:hypothetical protein
MRLAFLGPIRFGSLARGYNFDIGFLIAYWKCLSKTKIVYGHNIPDSLQYTHQLLGICSVVPQ